MDRGRERVPLFGELGLVSQLGSVEYARPRKIREKLQGWLDLVRTIWPECPASIDQDGTGLYVDREHALLTSEEHYARAKRFHRFGFGRFPFGNQL